MGKVEELFLDISPLTQNPRSVFVYLPTNYENSKKSYPVIYMFDGQNLFFDEMATYGKSWGMKDFLDNYWKDIIVVGVDCNHTGNSRLDEYSPFPFTSTHYEVKDALGDISAKWFVEYLKPYIDSNYRTLKDRKNTCVAGSSMGGLMSLYCIVKYNHIFSKAACLSPSLLFMFDEMFDLVKTSSLDKNTKIYMDFGTRELRYKNKLTHAMHILFDLNHELQNKGINCYPNLIQHGEHNEATWERVIPRFMKYFFEE